jgi:prevent-host-death family protein
MYVSSSRIQNNFGKYLRACEEENVIITKNGKKRALLLGYPRDNDGFEAGEPHVDYGTSPRKHTGVTYREFLELTEQSEQRYELIDGVVYAMASPSFTHQSVVGRLYMLFARHFESHQKCKPYLSPFDVDLVRESIRKKREVTEDDINVVQPDLMVLCDTEGHIDEKDRYKGTPALVIEILSPSSRSKDKIKKLDLYMDGGVAECWIVDPEALTISVFTFASHELDRDAVYPVGSVAASKLFPGLEVAVEEVFAR